MLAVGSYVRMGGMGRTSPVVAQFEFAARVRKRREELGLPAAVVSKHLGFTRNFYSAVENSRSLLATAKLPLLFEVLEFDETDAQTLTTLLDQARTPGWWQPYASVLDDSFAQYLGLECGAARISSYENFVFNGLLQCEEYALSVMSASPNASFISVRKALELRLRRQAEIFGSDVVPETKFLLGETLLWQQFDGPVVLRQQLRHLVELAEAIGPKMDIRIRPFKSTPVGLQTSSTLVILEFDSSDLVPLAYREAGAPLSVTSEPELVDLLRLHYSQAFDSSCSRVESIALLHQRIEELED